MLGMASFVVTMTGCALVSGLSSIDVGVVSDAGVNADAGVDAGADVSADVSADVPIDPCACGLTLPPGFSTTLFNPDNGKGQCPPQMKATTVVLNPQTLTAAGACTCSCSLGGCASPSLQFYDSSSCNVGLGTISITGQCQSSGVYVATSSIRGSSSTTSSCLVGAASFPAASAGQATLCADPSSCIQLCAPPLGMSLCMAATGDVACPNGQTKYLVADSIIESRSCSGCSCNVMAPACNVAVQFYGDNACIVPSGSPVTGNLTSCGISNAGASFIAKVTPSGSCSTQSGSASGAAVPTNLRTICCK
ncbi:hypothetical protein BH09MYX1_BH09MYX1_18100 [soil metagenome]